MVENHNSLPIKFEQIMNVLDDRFMKVKIWIAHTGENRNNSIFSKEVLESMIPSLANVPILGYIAEQEDGEADFEGHEERLVVEDGKFKLKYVGRAWGLIPETHNARFETRFGEDGVEREYLVCDGLIWREKFPEVEEIFDRDGGFKWQSMELQHSSVKGKLNEYGIFEFESAKFEGACILGEHVTPAMVSSTVEKFSVDNIQSDLREMLVEFNTHFSTIQEKGEETVPTNEEQVLENQTENAEFEAEQTPAEPVVEETPVENFEEQPVVEEPKEGEETPENFEEIPAVEETPVEETPAENFEEQTPAVEETPVVEEKFTVKFELSHDDIRSGLYDALWNHENFQDSWVYVSKVYDNHAIIEDEASGKFFKINYVKHENAVSLGEFEELFPMFLTQSEKATVDATRNNFEALEQEVKGLREFKSNLEMAEKEAKLNSYSAHLSKEEFDSIKENLAKFSIVDIEKEIGFLLLKKNNFSARNEAEPKAQVSAVNVVESNPYGDASIYFSK